MAMCILTVCLLVLVMSTCWLIPSSFSRSIVSRRFCDVGQFLNVQRGTCHNCTTTCPDNQIIRRTCSAVADSICGPFFEFRPQHEDAERNRVMQRQRLHQLLKQQWAPRRQQGTDWLLSTNDTEVEDNGPSEAIPSTESGVEPYCCWTNVGSLGILIAASLLVVMVTLLIILLFSWRFIRGRKSQPRVVSGASRQLRTRYHVTLPQVVSTSLSSAVDKRVKHLELQLRWNSQRRAGSHGTSSGPHPFGGNDYVTENLRKVLVSNSNTAI